MSFLALIPLAAVLVGAVCKYIMALEDDVTYKDFVFSHYTEWDDVPAIFKSILSLWFKAYGAGYGYRAHRHAFNSLCKHQQCVHFLVMHVTSKQFTVFVRLGEAWVYDYNKALVLSCDKDSITSIGKEYTKKKGLIGAIYKNLKRGALAKYCKK